MRAKRADIPTILNGIQGYSDKVAYYAFPEGQAPELPFIVYIFPDEAGFGADNINYQPTTSVQVEFYSRLKDPTQESLIEAALTANEIYYTKDSTFLEDEQAWMTVYSFEVI